MAHARCVTLWGLVQQRLQQVDQNWLLDYGTEYQGLDPREKDEWHDYFHEHFDGKGKKVSRITLQLLCPFLVEAYGLDNPATMGKLMEGLIASLGFIKC